MQLSLILTLGVAAFGIAGPVKSKSPVPTGWFARSVTSRSPGTTVTTGNGELAICALPLCANGAGPLAFIVTTSDVPLLGNQSGKTLSATFALPVTGGPQFTYWGATCYSCNPGTRPASVRLFFSTRTDVSTSYGDETWYSNPLSIDLAAVAGTATTLTQTLGDPSLWSNGQGKWGNDPAHASAFMSATANIKQVGFAFGGGTFFDVGVGVVNSTGSATFHVQSFTSQ